MGGTNLNSKTLQCFQMKQVLVHEDYYGKFSLSTFEVETHNQKLANRKKCRLTERFSQRFEMIWTVKLTETVCVIVLWQNRFIYENFEILTVISNLLDRKHAGKPGIIRHVLQLHFADCRQPDICEAKGIACIQHLGAAWVYCGWSGKIVQARVFIANVREILQLSLAVLCVWRCVFPLQRVSHWNIGTIFNITRAVLLRNKLRLTIVKCDYAQQVCFENLSTFWCARGGYLAQLRWCVR